MKILTIVAGALLAGTVHGQGSDAILDLLIKKGVITQREANEVRAQLDAQTAEAVALHSKAKNVELARFTGVFR